MSTETPSLRTITEEQLRKFWELDQRRKSLEREAAQLKKAQDLIGDPLKAALENEKRTEVRRGAYRAELRDGQVRPKWEQVVIEELGAEKAAAVRAETKPGKSLSVMRLEEPEA